MISPSRIHRIAVLVPALAACVLLAACATGTAPTLDVQPTAVRLVPGSAGASPNLLVTMRLSNRTGSDIAVSGTTVTVLANNRLLGNGGARQAFTVPRYGETSIDATVADPALVRQLAELRALSPTATFRIQGRAAAGMSGMPFDAEALLPVPAPN